MNLKEKDNPWSKIVIALLIVGPAFYFGSVGKPTEMGLSIVAGAIASCFLSIDKIEFFKGAGFEARTREEVKKVVDEAVATIEQLRSLGEPVIMALLKIIVYHKRIAGLSQFDQQELINDLDRISKAMELNNESEYLSTKETYYQFTTWDLYYLFTAAVMKNFDGQIFFHSLRDQLQGLLRSGTNEYPTREKIMEILGEHSQVVEKDGDAKETLQDYLYFIQHKKLRQDI